jgi:hypothetical protein
MEQPTAEDEPLWKRLANPADTATAAPGPTADAAPLWAQFSQETAQPVPSSAPVASSRLPPTLRDDAPLDALELSVLGTSDPDRRTWYTEELFSGNAADYRYTLLQLDAVRTWTAATDIIARDVFRKHSVNIYSEPAVTFTDAVEAQMEHR